MVGFQEFLTPHLRNWCRVLGNMWFGLVTVALYLCGLCLACFTYREIDYKRLAADKDPLYWRIYREHTAKGIDRCIADCSNMSTCVAINYDYQNCKLLGSVQFGQPFWNNSGNSPIYARRGASVELPVFRMSAGSGVSVYDSWFENAVSFPANSFVLSQRLDGFYKHRFVDGWRNQNIEQVKLKLYSSAIEEVTLEFNTDGEDKMSWFSLRNLQVSPWADLHSESVPNFFSIEGDPTYERRFFINSKYGNCANDVGWLVVTVRNVYCNWSSTPPFPSFRYAAATQAQLWQSGDIRNAEDLVISMMLKFQ